jgi:hypothetical protein
MTTPINVSRLRKALERTGNTWLLKYWGRESEKQLKKLGKNLEEFQRNYATRFKETPDVFGLVEDNPTKAAAFFQLDTLYASSEMKILIWRLLLGAEIDQIELKYKSGTGKMSLRIILSAPFDVEGIQKEEYETSNTTDYRVLRHFGLTGVNGHFELQGYYALTGER